MKRAVLVSCMVACLWSIPATAANISSQVDGGNDRIVELRGLAQALLAETQGATAVPEGEELVVRRGGRKGPAAQADSRYAQRALAKLGEGIQLDEIPELLRQLRILEEENHQALADQFGVLSAGEALQDEVTAFLKTTERFLQALEVDQFLLAAMNNKISQAMAGGGIGASQMAQTQGYRKMLADVQTELTGIRTEVGSMARYGFRIQNPALVLAQEIQTRLAGIWAEVDGIIRERSTNQAGRTQDLRPDMRERLGTALTGLTDLAARVDSLAIAYPAEATFKALQKSIADHQAQISALLKGPEGGPNEK